MGKQIKPPKFYPLINILISFQKKNIILISLFISLPICDGLTFKV